jgi:hypothetical protein
MGIGREFFFEKPRLHLKPSEKLNFVEILTNSDYKVNEKRNFFLKNKILNPNFEIILYFVKIF